MSTNFTSIKERLEGYLRNHHRWIPSADLQKLIMERTSYTPQNVGRRLRELAKEGKLEVMYVRNHEHFRSAHPKLEGATLLLERGRQIRTELR